DAHGEPRTILNVDLGASTTKLALCRGGEIQALTVLRIGTRCITTTDGRVSSLTEAGRRLAEDAAMEGGEGGERGTPDLRTLGARLAELILQVVERRSTSDLIDSVILGERLPAEPALDAVGFSGGGAEYVFEREDESYGDLGTHLGRGIRQRLN